MAEPNDVNVDELKRRARRRLVGAVVLALAAAVFVPMLLESDPKPLGEDVSVRIPPVDDGKFVNRLSDKGKIEAPKTPAKGEAAKSEGQKSEPQRSEAPRADAAAASAKDGAVAESPAKDSAAKEGAKEPAGKEAAAKDSTAKDAASASPAKSTLGDAERKMLNATSKPAPASSAPAKPPAATAAAPVPPATAPPTATAKAEGAPGFSVQLAAFADDKGANALSNKLKKSGYPAYTEPLTTSKGTLWRVRVGPFASRDAAASSRDKLKGEGYSGIVAPAN